MLMATPDLETVRNKFRLRPAQLISSVWESQAYQLTPEDEQRHSNDPRSIGPFLFGQFRRAWLLHPQPSPPHSAGKAY